MNNSNALSKAKKREKKRQQVSFSLKRSRQLHILLIPGVLHYIIFRYFPMFGIAIAFKDYNLYAGFTGSPWVGWENFARVFSSPDFILLIRNTLLLGISTLFWNSIVAIFFALVINEVRHAGLKRLVQSISFFPSLLSVVVVCSMVMDFLSPTSGVLNQFLASIGLEKHYFMVDPKWFRTIYVTSEVWQKFGYNAIIYLAALSGISSDLFESAALDGCGRLRRIWHVTLPGLLPTICTMTILNAGSIFRIGADKVLLLYNPRTYEVADIFGTYVYRKGIYESSFSYASAAGLFESVVAFIIVFSMNKLSKRVTENSLW